MHGRLHALIGTAMLLSSLVHIHAQAPADAIFYAVSYVEVRPSDRTTMTGALRQYRDASRRDDGHIRLDVFEQVGWPGHFAIVETWRDQKAFEAHSAAAHTGQFQDALRPIRVSGYDQRPYRTLTVAPAASQSSGQAVHVVAHVDAAPSAQGGKADAVTLLRRLADASRKEPGNLRFDVLQHVTRGNHFTVVESWQNQGALDAHAAASHAKQYRDELQPISGSPLDERLYKAVE